MELSFPWSLSPLDTGDGTLFLSAIRDVSERKHIEAEIRTAHLALAQTNRELEAARDAALLASKAKSDFLASMSHEIRTPLNGVLATASLLLEKSGDPETRHYAGMISRSSITLMRVIDDILDMSKIEAGRMVLEPVPERLEVIVEDIIEVHRSAAEHRGISLRSEYVLPLPASVSFDGARLRQVIGNLVGNAIKFTNTSNVEILVHALRQAERTWSIFVTVADTGIGISKANLLTIFEPFAQGDGETYHRYGGSGLGLAISKRIIDLMGGTITVQSTLGVGSRFTVQIECTEVSAVPVVQVQHTGPYRKGVSVLLAEDNEVNAIVATETLALLGCDVVHAWDGQEAVEQAAAHDFDLILLDVHMPHFSGIEACRRIRLNGKDIKTPIGALTASVTPDEITKCLSAGMEFVVGKPFTVGTIREMLSELFPLVSGDSQPEAV